MAGNVNFYASWQPVRINAGLDTDDSGESGGFFINDTGLQWSSNNGQNAADDEFGGWLGKWASRPHSLVRCTDASCSLRLVARRTPTLLPLEVLQLVRARGVELCRCLPHA